MNAIIRGLLAAALVILPATAHAGTAHGAREYRQTGYYQWDAYKCKWIWYAYAKQTYGTYDNHSQTYHFTINNFQSSARRGETQYGVTEAAYQYGHALDPNATLNFARELLSTAYRGANDGFNQAMLYASQQGANDVEVAKEFAQVQKLQATAQVLESSKPQASATYFRQGGGGYASGDIAGPVKAFAGAQVAAGAIAAAEAKCMTCHADGQKAEGHVLQPFATFNAVSAEQALNYIVRLDEHNCAKRAALTAEEHKALRQFFEAKKVQ